MCSQIVVRPLETCIAKLSLIYLAKHVIAQEVKSQPSSRRRALPDFFGGAIVMDMLFVLRPEVREREKSIR